MANVAVGQPLCTQRRRCVRDLLQPEVGVWFAIVLVLATQLTGFGLAGCAAASSCGLRVWYGPQNLVACTLLNTLHAEDEDDGIGMGLGGVAERGCQGTSFS